MEILADSEAPEARIGHEQGTSRAAREAYAVRQTRELDEAEQLLSEGERVLEAFDVMAYNYREGAGHVVEAWFVLREALEWLECSFCDPDDDDDRAAAVQAVETALELLAASVPMVELFRSALSAERRARWKKQARRAARPRSESAYARRRGDREKPSSRLIISTPARPCAPPASRDFDAHRITHFRRRESRPLVASMDAWPRTNSP